MLTTVAAILTFLFVLGIPAFASNDPATAERLLRLRRQAAEQQKRLNKLQEDFNKEFSKTLDLGEIGRKAVEEVNKQRRKDNEDILSQRGEELAKESAIHEAQRARLETFKDQLELANFREEQANRELEAIRAAIAANEITGQQADRLLATNEAILAAASQVRQSITNQIDPLKTSVEETEQRVDNAEAAYKAEEQILDSVAALGGAFAGLGARVEDSLLFKLKDAYDTLGGFGPSLEVIGQQLDSSLDPMNIAASVFSKVGQSTIQMALAADTAFASFNRTTGAAGQLDDVIMEARIDTAALGVSFQGAVEATQELYTNLRQFTLIGEQAQQQMVEFTAVMDRLGVSASSTSTFLNLSISSLGMTAEQATTTARELMATGAALGMLPGEMIEGFNAALPTLAKFGDEAVEVFKGLSAAAKATGADVQSLLNVVSQFDTFEDAANAAGRLNAILGGDLLNSVDLLNASEDERIRMLIQSIELSGRSFSEMGRFERQAVANAAGIRDMAVANQLFDTSLAAYDRQQAASQAGAMSQAEMEERARQNTSAQEQLAIAFESLAIATRPLVSIMNATLDLFMTIQSVTREGFVPALGLLLFMLKKLGVAGTRMLGSFGAAVMVFMVLRDVFDLTTPVAAALAGGIFAIGVATKFTMGPIGLLVTALGLLGMYIMAPMHSPPLYIGIFILAAGVFLLGKAATGGSIGLGMLALVAFAVGAAAVMMGFGVMLAAEGIATMFEQLAAVPPAQLFAIAFALMALASAFSAIGLTMLMPWATLGLAAVAAGMFAIGAAFRNMSVEKITAFEEMTERMKSLDPATAIGLRVVASGVEDLAEAIGETPVIRGLILTQIMGKMTDLAEAVTPTAMASAKEMVEVVKEISSIKLGFTNMILFDKAVDNLVKILQGAGLGPGGAGTAGRSEPKTVILEIDKRQLAKTIIELINERYDLKAAS